MKYLKTDEVHAGQKIKLDEGFTCVKAQEAELHSDEDGQLYFNCSCGRHFIDGQLDSTNSHYIGISSSN